MKIIEGSHTSRISSFNLSHFKIHHELPVLIDLKQLKSSKLPKLLFKGLDSHKKLCYLYNNLKNPGFYYDSTINTHNIVDNVNSTSDGGGLLYMTRKVTYGYRYDPEKVRKKGTVRSKIYFDMWKDKDPYYVIHKFLYENDPDNKNFKYDIDLAKKVKCKRNIFAHYKKDNRLRFFWYASRKNYSKGPFSRYINFAIDRNEFRFSKLHSYFHILPYVHEHYKDDPRYIYFMNRFLSRHGRIAEFKRLSSANNSSNSTDDKDKDAINSADSVNDSSGVTKTWYSRDITWKEIMAKAKMEEEELFSKISTEPIKVDLGNDRSFTVKRDGFKVHGEYYSKINKKNRETPYDIYSPFLRTKHSSRRRRYREKIPIDPSLRFKTRRERLIHNAKNRDVKEFIKKYIKRKPKQNN
uniref:Uncharacterized protein n=1 Tax=Theileria annulata TaxID=5874 RepID=A0A3B0MU34_THEAN